MSRRVLSLNRAKSTSHSNSFTLFVVDWIALSSLFMTTAMIARSCAAVALSTRFPISFFSRSDIGGGDSIAPEASDWKQGNVRGKWGGGRGRRVFRKKKTGPS